MISVKIFPLGLEEIGVQALVYPTRDAMYEGMRAWGFSGEIENTQAACMGMEGGEKICAAMFFYEDNVGFDVIAHECWHATCRWLATQGVRTIPTRYKKSFISAEAPEERGARYHGELVNATLQELFKRTEISIAPRHL